MRVCNNYTFREDMFEYEGRENMKVCLGGITFYLLMLVLMFLIVPILFVCGARGNNDNVLRCSKVVVFTEGTTVGELNINTNYSRPVQATIIINETGEVVYKSKLIKLFDGVYKDKLAVDLEQGKYKCKVTLVGWDDAGYEWKLATKDMVIVVEQ